MEMHYTPDPEIDAWLSRTAVRQGRDRESIVNDILRERMGYDLMFARKVDEGILAADRGETVSREEAGRQMEQWIKQHNASR
jgi:predicted transcriptional regulator